MVKISCPHTTLVVLFMVFLNCGFSQHAKEFIDHSNGLTGCEDHCPTISSKFSKLQGISGINPCKRGCRLFRICESMSSNLTEASHVCKLACIESYQSKNNRNQAACIDGCNAALPYAQAHRTKLASEASRAQDAIFFHLPSLVLIRDPFKNTPLQKDDQVVFGGLDDMVNNMMDSASRSLSAMFPFMSSSHVSRTQVIEVFDGSNHEVIIVERVEPRLSIQPGEKKVVLNSDSLDSKRTLSADRDNIVDLSKPNGYFDRIKYKTQHWWSNFTRKAGLPELVLLLFWISTSVLLVMTCFAQFHPLSKKKLSINGDLAFITDSQEKLPSYMQAYPCPENGEKSPYYIASVVQVGEEKAPMMD